MDQLVDGVLHLDESRQIVFRLGLIQQVQTVLRASNDFHDAISVVDFCWQWVEHSCADGLTLYQLYHADDDSGVETAMNITYGRSDKEWHAWGRVCDVLAYTGYCVFKSKEEQPPEVFTNDFPSELISGFLNDYHAVVGLSEIPETLVSYLRNLPDDKLKRAVIEAKCQ